MRFRDIVTTLLGRRLNLMCSEATQLQMQNPDLDISKMRYEEAVRHILDAISREEIISAHITAEQARRAIKAINDLDVK